MVLSLALAFFSFSKKALQKGLSTAFLAMQGPQQG